MTKTCPLCLKEKPLHEFIKNTKTSTGFGSYCKLCAREYSKKHYHSAPQQKMQKVKEWQMKNPELVRRYNNTRSNKNPKN